MAINREDLFIRIAVGAVYIAITGICATASWWSCLAIMAITSGFCCFEFLDMASKKGHRPYKVTGTIAAFLIPLSVGLNIYGVHVIGIALAVAFVAAVVVLFMFFVHDEDSIVDVSLTIFGYLYTGLTLTSFIMLRAHIPDITGGLMCLFILLSIWGNDAFAYLGGSAFGKHKFAPKVSPKKTWEGVICGMVGGMLLWLPIPLVCPSCGFGIVWTCICGLLCGASGIIGDLTESHIKRSLGAKDSGKIMPGHGGLLDRSDSLLFASVVAYCLVVAVPSGAVMLGVVLP